MAVVCTNLVTEAGDLLLTEDLREIVTVCVNVAVFAGGADAELGGRESYYRSNANLGGEGSTL